MSFIEDALRLVEINSISEHGNEELVNYLIPIFEKMGMKLLLQQVPHSLEDHSKRQYNLIGILGDDLVDSRTRKGLLLISHMDTAGFGDATNWKELDGRPFAPKVKDNSVLGLGVARSKLDFACKLAACERYLKTPLKEPIYLVASCGGESALSGAKYLIQSGILNPKYVMVGHPTDMKLQLSHKAQVVFDIKVSYVAVERDVQEFNAKLLFTTKGKSGHVALDPEDQSLLALPKIFYLLEELVRTRIPLKLISLESTSSLNRIPDTASLGVVVPSRDMESLREFFRDFDLAHPDHGYELKFGGTGDRGMRFMPDQLLPTIASLKQMFASLSEEWSKTKDSRFCPQHSTLSLTHVSQTRDSISFRLQAHLLPELASPEAKKRLEQDVKRSLEQIATNFRSLSFDCRRVVSLPRFYQDPASIFVQTLNADLERSGIVPEHTVGNTCTDAAYFCEKSYPTVVVGPGVEKKNTHTPQEQVDLDKLYSALRFYTQVIETCCVRGI